MHSFSIQRPTLLVNDEIVEANIERMLQKAQKWNVQFRPHFKTHQSAYYGEFFRRKGISRIAVSSLKMAEYFTQHGWKDILVAFPVNALEHKLINQLLESTYLSVFLEDIPVAEKLNISLNKKLGIYLKIDAGYGRTGIEIEKTEEIFRLIESIQKSAHLHWKGFGIHAGNSYHSSGKQAIIDLAKQLEHKIGLFRESIGTKFGTYQLSFGDTPILSVADNFQGIDEIRPGNFVFYDAMQWKAGSCDFADIAVALAAPVVAKHCHRNELVIYGGAIHLSKEYLVNADGSKNFGFVSKLTHKGWTEPIAGTYVKSLSQEHGIIKLSAEECNKIEPGDVLAIIPIHSCLSANLMGKYLNTNGLNIEMFRYTHD